MSYSTESSTTRRWLRFAAVCSIVPVWLACSAQSDRVGGETNWLTLCERDADCPDTPCRCGVCTTECGAPGDCQEFERATCAGSESNAAERQCGATAVAICLPECTRNADCQDDQRCASGACILTAETMGDAPAAPGGGSMTRQVDNPTGDCVAQDDGGRVEHSPDSTDVYLPDCELDLAREYYRVFVQEDDTAYMIPRPDAHPAFVWACINEQDPLHATLQEYSLCQSEALDAEQISKVNGMRPGDALAVSHYLHERLVFFVTETGVSPYPMAQDILDLCKTDEQFRNGPMQERCDFELAAENGPRAEIGWIHTGEQAEVLAAALNELYGIVDDELCQRLSNDASGTLTRVLYAAPQPCSVAEDCVRVGHASACHDACSAVISTDNQADFETAVTRIDAEQCAMRDAAGCGPTIAPPCIPPQDVVCVDGQCGEGTSE